MRCGIFHAEAQPAGEDDNDSDCPEVVGVGELKATQTIECLEHRRGGEGDEERHHDVVADAVEPGLRIRQDPAAQWPDDMGEQWQGRVEDEEPKDGAKVGERGELTGHECSERDHEPRDRAGSCIKQPDDEDGQHDRQRWREWRKADGRSAVDPDEQPKCPQGEPPGAEHGPGPCPIDEDPLAEGREPADSNRHGGHEVVRSDKAR